MCLGSTLSYPHKEFLNPHPHQVHPAPAPLQVQPASPRSQSSAGSRTGLANAGTRPAQDYNLYTSLAHSQDFLNLLESEHLVCSATATTKTELGIIQLWFNYFAASFYRELGIRFFWEAKERDAQAVGAFTPAYLFVYGAVMYAVQILLLRLHSCFC